MTPICVPIFRSIRPPAGISHPTSTKKTLREMYVFADRFEAVFILGAVAQLIVNIFLLATLGAFCKYIVVSC